MPKRSSISGIEVDTAGPGVVVGKCDDTGGLVVSGVGSVSGTLDGDGDGEREATGGFVVSGVGSVSGTSAGDGDLATSIVGMFVGVNVGTTDAAMYGKTVAGLPDIFAFESLKSTVSFEQTTVVVAIKDKLSNDAANRCQYPATHLI
ncbi:MAG: hypothetical protein VB824_09670 [Dehalococcoidia bacterium]